MFCYFQIKNNDTTFTSKIFEVLDDRFEDMCKDAQSFGMGSWSMDTDEGFMIIPAEICKRSILLINKIEKDGLQE